MDELKVGLLLGLGCGLTKQFEMRTFPIIHVDYVSHEGYAVVCMIIKALLLMQLSNPD